MSRRRSNNSWRTAIRDARKIPSDQSLEDLVRYVARRAAEDDYKSLLQRQRERKLREAKEPTKN